MTRALRRKGVDVARCTVERLMAELEIEGVICGRGKVTLERVYAVTSLQSEQATSATPPFARTPAECVPETRPAPWPPSATSRSP
ncbi:IS3 family transposase [Streptomyces sp. x-19]|uniref:IS3 family transposase n=1 Tax=Streptomyces sp. x-19 TaxID=2789280 RepID=UPI00397F21D1